VPWLRDIRYAILVVLQPLTGIKNAHVCVYVCVRARVHVCLLCVRVCAPPQHAHPPTHPPTQSQTRTRTHTHMLSLSLSLSHTHTHTSLVHVWLHAGSLAQQRSSRQSVACEVSPPPVHGWHHNLSGLLQMSAIVVQWNRRKEHMRLQMPTYLVINQMHNMCNLCALRARACMHVYVCVCVCVCVCVSVRAHACNTGAIHANHQQ
jgi:hypothetical protein